MQSVTEVRYRESGFRVFTVFPVDADHVTVRTGTGRVEGTTMTALVKSYGLNGCIASMIGREQWYERVTKAQAGKRLAAWRRLADREGYGQKGVFRQ